jgi:DNA primase
MEKEGVEFPEALRMLARDAGIALEAPDAAAAAAARSKEALYAACDWACRWFEGNLRGSPGADYLRGRGLEGATAKAWRLGWAPEGWDGLLRAGRAAGHDPAVLEAAGLLQARKEGGRGGDGWYDFFRGRVTFPIADPRGRVVAFGARTLGDEPPKYVNSHDTPIFRKGELLFGLDRARDEALRTRTLAVMEGYMDAIMAHQHGIANAVAGLGTAFTPHHAALMARYADRVLLVYDTDAAGKAATGRALGVLLPSDVEARVAVLPEGKDPCDLLVARGPAPLRASFEAARDVFEFLLAAAKAGLAAESASGPPSAARLQAVADGMIETALRIPPGVKRDRLLQRIGGSFGFTEDGVRRRVRELAAASAPRTPEAAAAGAAREAARPRPPAPSEERLLLEAVLAEPSLAGALAREAPPGSFEDAALGAVARALLDTAAGGRADPAACGAALQAAGDAGVLAAFDALVAAASALPGGDHRRQFEDCVRRRNHARDVAEATRRHDAARTAGDEAEADRWLAEIGRLQADRKRRPRNGER